MDYHSTCIPGRERVYNNLQHHGYIKTQFICVNWSAILKYNIDCYNSVGNVRLLPGAQKSLP
jgi:hypothetical protein